MQVNNAKDKMTRSAKDIPTVIEVTRGNLPAHCPSDDNQLWSSHPRVYIPVEASGSASCSYCGAVFKLVD